MEMENHNYSSAAPPKAKGKSVAAADDKELKTHVIAERKRRNQMRDYYGELQPIIPQIPEKSDRGTVVAHAIDYIQYIEKTKAMVEKIRQEVALARQVAAEAAGSSSSAPLPPPPQSVQGMAVVAMSSDVPDAGSDVSPPLLQPLAAAVPVPAPPQVLPAGMSSDVLRPPQQPLAAAEPATPPQRTFTATPVGFQTWAWPDLVLSVSNDNAFINVCAPRHLGMRTMVMVLSVLDKYGIDVVSAQVDSDAVHLVLNIYARVTAITSGENPSALEVYQLAVSEILACLTTI